MLGHTLPCERFTCDTPHGALLVLIIASNHMLKQPIVSLSSYLYFQVTTKLTPTSTPLLCFNHALLVASHHSCLILPLRVKLLVEAVQAMHIALRLRTHCSQLEPDLARKHTLAQFNQALLANILHRVL